MPKNKKINQVEPFINKEDADAVYKYLNTGGWVTEHNVTRKFESLVKDKVGRKSAIAVPNGTIAIYLGLIAAGIKKGDRVAVPNLTMIATINAVMWASATPVLVDVDSDLTMSYEKLKQLKNLKAVIYVPLNGRTANGLEIQKWCKENKILLVEDSAHALGSKYSNNQMCGSLGDISIFSFTPHKIITTGQGGMILTDNKRIGNEIDKLKSFNRRKDKIDWHDGFGLNFKFTDLQASLGVSQFKSLNKRIKFKKDLYSNYNNIKSSKFSLGKFKKYETPWFIDLFSSTQIDIKKLQDKLSKEKIETRNSYPALSKQSYLKNLDRTDLSFSESVHNKILWIPSSINLSKENQTKIIKEINEYK
tara:strand:+ start:156 stop:1241 length:1086 start_codon:yes stop_codon:yes gene_type:complete